MRHAILVTREGRRPRAIGPFEGLIEAGRVIDWLRGDFDGHGEVAEVIVLDDPLSVFSEHYRLTAERIQGDGQDLRPLSGRSRLNAGASRAERGGRTINVQSGDDGAS